MIIHQAYYGEKNKGHSLICSSFETNEVPKRISLETDLPSNSSNINWKPFYSGFATQEHYVLLKTYPDKDAGRGAFVFTHALFIQNKNLETLNDLNTILNLFPKDFIRSESLNPLEIKNLNDSDKKLINQGSLSMISELIEGEKVIWGGEEGFIDLVNLLWNSIYTKNRSEFSFRLSFSYKDYEKSNITIAYTPMELSDKWVGYKIIDVNSVNNTKNKALEFITKSNENDIYKVSKEIGKQPTNIQELKKWQLFSECYYSEKKDILIKASLVRDIEEISPMPNDCIVFKSQLWEELISDLKIGDLKGILLLRNISLKSFQVKVVEASLTPIFKQLIKNSFESNGEEKELMKILKSTTKEEVEEWWKVQVRKSYKAIFTKLPEQGANLLWSLIREEIEFLNELNALIPINIISENVMVLSLPKELSETNFEEVLDFSKNNKWNSLFGAVTTLKYDKLAEGIKFLKAESENNELELRIKAYVLALSVKDFVKMSSETADELLINVTVTLLIENPKLKSFLTLKTTTGISILERTINEGIAFCEGFINTINKRNEILDAFLEGEILSDIIWKEIQVPELSDLSLYDSRMNMWSKIPLVHKPEIILNTAKEWVRNYLNDNLTNKELEIELKSIIIKNKFVEDLIGNEDYQLSKILELLFLININSESNFKTLLQERAIDFDKNDCDSLSILVIKNKWKDTYKYIKNELVSKNYHFQTLVDKCKNEFKSRDEKIVEAIFGKKKNNKMKKNIFISYSRKDVDFKDELRVHLKPLVRSEMVSDWACEDMRSGEWDEQIKNKLEEADIIIYMVSANFMASDYIIDNEVKIGIEMAKKDTSKKIMCVLVRECMWRNWSLLDENFEETNSSDLSRFQFLPYYKSNGQEELLSLEEWGIGDIKPISVAFKQIMDKLITEVL